MTATDVTAICAIAVFLSAWLIRAIPGRRILLASSAAVIFLASLAGVFDSRWQAGAGLVTGAVFILALAVRAWRNKAAPSHGKPFRTPFISGAIFALLGGLSIAAICFFPVSPLPPPGGRHAVGIRSFELTDTTRPGLLGAKAGEARRLLVRVWYPAEKPAGAQPRAYFDAAESTSTARGLGEVLHFPTLLTYLKHVRTNSYENAPLLAGTDKRATIFYSHGYTSFAGQNAALMEDLASHGYIVYAVQHTYDSAATVFPNGDVLPSDPALTDRIRQSPQSQGQFSEAVIKGFTSSDFDDRLAGQMQSARDFIAQRDRIVTMSAPIWVADRIFVHDMLEKGAVPKDVADIVAAGDLTRTGEMGMSFGGSVTGALCLVDRRCAAGINLDGGDFNITPFDADMPVPFLMFHADFGKFYRHFGVTPSAEMRGANDFSYERFEHAGQRDDLYRLQLKGAAHLGFSDLTLFMRRPLRDAILGSVPAPVMIGVQNDVVRGFFDKHLRGIANNFPQAQYEAYADWIAPYDTGAIREWWLAKPASERLALERDIDEMKSTLPR